MFGRKSRSSKRPKPSRKNLNCVKIEFSGPLSTSNRSIAHKRPQFANSISSRPQSRRFGAVSQPAPLSSGPTPADRIIFAENSNFPGIPVVFRTEEARKQAPERLNLDRRRLTQCPVLENEHRLRLLNYQHNHISSISNLINLPNLIFLDLYDNSIQEISGLDTLPTLRVLMLGKNNIRRISGLDSLTKLEVLDLHSNKIETIENLNTLQNLRVLNLAGNRILRAENLDSLSALNEINLRRNKILSMSSLQSLNRLNKLFLSSNQLGNLDSVLSRLPEQLIELSLENNPLYRADSYYKQKIIVRLSELQLLDGRKVSNDQRNMASSMIHPPEVLSDEEARVHIEEKPSPSGHPPPNPRHVPHSHHQQPTHVTHAQQTGSGITLNMDILHIMSKPESMVRYGDKNVKVIHVDVPIKDFCLHFLRNVIRGRFATVERIEFGANTVPKLMDLLRLQNIGNEMDHFRSIVLKDQVWDVDSQLIPLFVSIHLPFIREYNSTAISLTLRTKSNRIFPFTKKKLYKNQEHDVTKTTMSTAYVEELLNDCCEINNNFEHVRNITNDALENACCYIVNNRHTFKDLLEKINKMMTTDVGQTRISGLIGHTSSLGL
ncbi:hypothetical protein PCE1_000136 [Barthelona sp. PCE]